ncbi:glycosyltransferase family 4 protein [Microbacterium deminutum]|uniref:D-inositol 3-phosphate glycosyltransferase n=1 Tax=Microbacterium deminutum TaxID=344164 RepID=A0ABP5BWV2_9MICO
MIEDAFGFDLLDESDLLSLPGLRGWLLRRIPAFLALALEVARRRRNYDVVVSWSEKHTVAIAMILALLPTRPRHLALLFWISKPVVRIPLRLFRSGVDRVITWSSVQRDVAVGRVGFKPDEIVLVHHPVDEEFFAPVETERRILFSAGSTQRDFPTLIEAVRTIDMPLRIAASVVVELRALRMGVVDVRDQADLPSNVTIAPLEPEELRAAYASARVVVVPLQPTDIDAGVSVILEAMAMGRPVVVSRTVGQVDVIRDGVTGTYVEPGDPVALRMVIESLLNDPKMAEAMGARAREYVLVNHRVEDFADRVRSEAHGLAGATSGPPRAR